MPALLAPMLGFVSGVLLAWAASGSDDRFIDEPSGIVPWTRGTTVVALFALLVFVPIHGYFLAFAGDWSYSYFLDSRHVPSALELMLVTVDAALVIVGYELARRKARSGSFGSVIALAAFPSALALVLVLLLFPRLRVDATFHQFRSDFGTEPVAGGPLGYAVFWMSAMLLAGLAVTAHALRPRRPAPEHARGAKDPDRPERH